MPIIQQSSSFLHTPTDAQRRDIAPFTLADQCQQPRIIAVAAAAAAAAEPVELCHVMLM